MARVPVAPRWTSPAIHRSARAGSAPAGSAPAAGRGGSLQAAIAAAVAISAASAWGCDRRGQTAAPPRAERAGGDTAPAAAGDTAPAAGGDTAPAAAGDTAPAAGDGTVAAAQAAPGDAAPAPADTGPPLEIIDRPIRFDAERIRLALEYRRIHSDPAADDLEIEPRMIVIHHTGGNSADGTWRYFNRVRMEGAREKLARAGAVNVASHFLVDRDGTCYRLMPETRMGRHAIGLNHIAIGVENVGDRERYPLTDAQLATNARLVRALASRHPITHLVGHHETYRLEEHPYFVERQAGYRNRKSDPGPAFMARLRAEVADLGLEGAPAAP